MRQTNNGQKSDSTDSFKLTSGDTLPPLKTLQLLRRQKTFNVIFKCQNNQYCNCITEKNKKQDNYFEKSIYPDCLKWRLSTGLCNDGFKETVKESGSTWLAQKPHFPEGILRQ